ncbi:PEP-CTERM sorting domain-containing protein [Denitrobaculum tricleocarpae]
MTRHAAAAVPEPATLLTLATGLLALGGAGRLRRRRKSVAA